MPPSANADRAIGVADSPPGDGEVRLPLAVFLPNRPFLGASLVLVPALLHLRRRFPGHRIIGLANNPQSAVFARWGLVDSLLTYDGPSGSLSDALRRTLGKRFACVVNFRPRSEFVHAWTLALKTEERRCFAQGIGRFVQPDGRRWDATRYKADTYLGLVGAGWHEHAGDLLAAWSLPSPVASRGHLTLVPCGSLSEKKWPISHYTAIAARWAERVGGPIHVLAGPDEPEVHAWLAGYEARAVGAVRVRGGLAAEAAAVRGSALVIGNDCGPNHLAQLFDRPRIVLFPAWGQPGEWFRPAAHAAAVQPAPRRLLQDVRPDAVWSMARAIAATPFPSRPSPRLRVA